MSIVPPALVLAHVGAAPAILAALAAVGLLYGAGIRRLRAQPGGRGAVGPARATAFVVALVALAAALASPLESLAATWLPAHMIQHLLLLVVAAPLLVVASPMLALSRCIPHRAMSATRHVRHRLGRVRHGSGWRLLPLAWLLHLAAVWVWHLPGPFQRAVESPPLHALEHTTLLLTATGLWWGVFHVAHRQHAGGAAVLSLFSTSVLIGGLGALLTFSSDPWYPTYVIAVDGDALFDQQVAGLVMWMGGGMVYLGVGIGIFLRWLERIDRGSRVRPRPELLALVAIAVLVGACDRALTDTSTLEAGSVAQGRETIQEYGCAACHQIGGIRGPQGSVGPPLDGLADRRTVAGHLPHTPENLARWIQDPQEIEPETIMPDLGVTDEDVADIISYLYSLDS